MALRWYSIVIDSRDPASLARWWGETLAWPLVYESEDGDESVIAPPFADEVADTVPREQRPQELVFVPVPEEKTVKNRLHIDLAPAPDESLQEAVDGLVARGAARADVGQQDVPWVVLTDPEGNEFCVLTPRE
ncbi:VOC family protein [Curtobacterium sp. VKM Ac-2865]|uniref:VOC family protein n=1 Tax=Curtobacterium sp. VKM Ac-2865 TaxID=2783817 RepID=UPI00188A6ECD|nr:VOC family protein [Curtobacterium sp. VKM Ac-2865]MBF4581396.1 VOC family protein [Curtobacterium sp. VKM Ac-2865]